MLLSVDFRDVPDKIEPILPGIYDLEVTTVPEIKPTKKGTGNNLVVQFAIATDGPFKGRKITDNIFLNELGLIKVKNLITGLGMTPGNGIQLEEMLGKQAKGAIVENKYQDESTGEAVVSSKIKSYITAA